MARAKRARMVGSFFYGVGCRLLFWDSFGASEKLRLGVVKRETGKYISPFGRCWIDAALSLVYPQTTVPPGILHQLYPSYNRLAYLII